jgi:uncharacterized membrane protein YeaQ/YmgE (transglycosylase-associated protein family)
MGILITLLIGGFIGWLAASLMGRSEGVFASIGIGIVGAIIGNVLSHLFGAGSVWAFSFSDVLWAFVGALLFVGLLNALQRRSHQA